MKKIILSIIILVSFCFTANSHVEHYAKFNYLEYELFRNDKLIGYHKYDFVRNKESLVVKSEVNFKIYVTFDSQNIIFFSNKIIFMVANKFIISK